MKGLTSSSSVFSESSSLAGRNASVVGAGMEEEYTRRDCSEGGGDGDGMVADVRANMGDDRE